VQTTPKHFNLAVNNLLSILGISLLFSAKELFSDAKNGFREAAIPQLTLIRCECR